MRFTKSALAALSCTFVLASAGVAAAGSGPAPTERIAASSTAPSAAGNPASSKARAAGVCSDAYQIGSTGYVYHDGAKAASVKQFYSPACHENYGYVWVWDSFKQSAGDYDVSAGVYSYSSDELYGVRAWTNTTAQEFWSYGAATVSECTAANGILRGAGDPVGDGGISSKRC